MNAEFKLKLQACLDGELSTRDARDVEAQLQAAPEARALQAELQSTRALLRGNEPAYTLPESGDFYWSKIERAIRAADEAAGRRSHPFSLGWLFRHWPQLSGAVAGAALLLFAAAQFHWFSRPGWEDIENPLAETGTFWFRSEPDRMTLVWVYDQAEEHQEEDPEAVN